MDIIADDIYYELYITDKVRSWGSKGYNFRKLDNGLQFKVNCCRFKGYVRIIYNYGTDRYEVSFGRLYKGRWQGKKYIDEMYFDVLVDLIDQFFEYKPQYKF